MPFTHNDVFMACELLFQIFDIVEDESNVPFIRMSIFVPLSKWGHVWKSWKLLPLHPSKEVLMWTHKDTLLASKLQLKGKVTEASLKAKSDSNATANYLFIYYFTLVPSLPANLEKRSRFSHSLFIL